MKFRQKTPRPAAESAASFGLVRWWLRIKPGLNRLFLNRYFMLAEFATASFIVICGREVVGAVGFACLIMAALVLCDDLLAIALPLGLLCVFLTKCYDSADTFLPFIWVAVPAVLSIIFHLVFYKRKWSIGPNFWGGVAVTLAVTLGGLGTISAGEYFNATSLYYTGFLGIGMLLAYLIARAYISERQDYNVFEKFAGIMYAVGAFASLAVLNFYYPVLGTLIETRQLVYFQSSNNLATFLMISMPYPCYFSLKSKKHLLGFGLIYLCILLSGSRGGLLMGTVKFFFCLLYLCITDKKSRFSYVCLFVAAAGLAYMNVGNILSFYGIYSASDLVSQNEVRYHLILRMIEDFKSNMLFGRGIGYKGNEDLYSPVRGAMNWYHMMIPQIVGSLGLLGVAAYLLQWIIRAATVLRRTDAYKMALGLSYLGLFLMSQVNPGEFCPIPYALYAAVIFAVLENYSSSKKPR